MTSRCGCDFGDATGPLCEVENSVAFSWAGSGDEGSEFSLVPILNPSVNNILTCGVNGMLVQLPSLLANPPSARAFKTSNTSIANNTLTAVNLNQEDYDTDTMHSLVSNTNRLTFTQAGYYEVTANCTWNKSITGVRYAEIRKNGTDVLGFESKPVGGDDLFTDHSILVEDSFSAADYVELLVYQNSGATLILLTGGGSPVLAATRVA